MAGGGPTRRAGKQRRPRLTDAERRQITDDIAAGELSRNDIAKKYGRSGSTIGAIAEAAGLSFDRAKTEKATAARLADLEARKAELAAALLEDAEQLRTMLWAPAMTHHWHQGRMHAAFLPQPTYADQQRILTATAIAIDKIEVLLPAGESDDGRSDIAALREAMEARRAERRRKR